MNILHAVGCVAALLVASCAAVSVSTCVSIGFTGFAALVGAVAVIAIIQ